MTTTKLLRYHAPNLGSLARFGTKLKVTKPDLLKLFKNVHTNEPVGFAYRLLV